MTPKSRTARYYAALLKCRLVSLAWQGCHRHCETRVMLISTYRVGRPCLLAHDRRRGTDDGLIVKLQSASLTGLGVHERPLPVGCGHMYVTCKDLAMIQLFAFGEAWGCG